MNVYFSQSQTRHVLLTVTDPPHTSHSHKLVTYFSQSETHHTNENTLHSEEMCNVGWALLCTPFGTATSVKKPTCGQNRKTLTDSRCSRELRCDQTIIFATCSARKRLAM